MSSELKQVYQVFIQASPERVWEAITTSKFTTQYYFGSPIESDWQPGSTYSMPGPDGSAIWIDGTIIEADPGRRLVQTFNAHWKPELDGEKATRVTWDIEKMGDACKLTVVHDEFEVGALLYDEVDDGGWSQILSGLKTLLEVGKPLVVEMPEPASAG
jgi:uncharacterized protein YndB with AHSA1/START domain